jgi:hypothetical protein
MVTVTGHREALAVFTDGLDPDKVQVQMLDGAVRVSGIEPADLDQVLSLVEQGGLSAVMEGRGRLVQGVAARLHAWEFELAMEAKATKAQCVSCGGSHLMPVTQCRDQTGRTVSWWCRQCSGFRSWAVLR